MNLNASLLISDQQLFPLTGTPRQKPQAACARDRSSAAKALRRCFCRAVALALCIAACPSSLAQEQIVRYSFANLAGMPGGAGNADGVGSAARFDNPSSVAADSAGNIYVADTYNQTIRKITPAGVVTTLAGLAGSAGSVDGTGSGARFNYPYGVAVDSAGNVYVAGTDNTTRKVTPAGVVTTLPGTHAGYGVAVDSAGNVFVTANNAILKLTPTGVVTTLAGQAGANGSVDGTGGDARFSSPTGLAVDGEGNVFVADYGNSTIRKVTPVGVVTTLAGRAPGFGGRDGTGSGASFRHPTGVAVDSAGNVYVADNGNSTIRKVTPPGVVTTLAGAHLNAYGDPVSGSEDGTGSAARFNGPQGVAVDSAGNVYVADTENNTIRKVTPDGVVTTAAGLVASPGSADGTGKAARFAYPYGVAVDSSGNVYVADAGNSAIRKVTPAGVVATLAGLAGASGSLDGTGSAARFYSPKGVAVDSMGNVFVADTGNCTIRKVTPTGVVTTLAGLAGQFDSADGTGSDARFDRPQGVAVDSVGNVYVADFGNATIRKVTPLGVVTTLAGLAHYQGTADGTWNVARFTDPNGVAIDSAGNIYVADGGNSTIRKITPGGVVTTLAGQMRSPGSADGTGSDARFYGPSGVAVDTDGNIYAADGTTIRKVTPAGLVTTLAGLPSSVGSADGMGSDARFSDSYGLAVDSVGNIYVADLGNNRITKGTKYVVSGLTPRILGIEVVGIGRLKLAVEVLGALTTDLAVETTESLGSLSEWTLETNAVITTDSNVAGSFGIRIEPTATVQFYRIRVGQ